MDSCVTISIIVAVGPDGIIGNNDGLPWTLPDDLRHFKELTMGHTVIVGRKTHESILRRLGHSLTGRRTIVVSRTKEFREADVRTAHSFEEALGYVLDEKEVFVIGGAAIYALALPIASRIYYTQVYGNVAGDTRFPPTSQQEWRYRRIGQDHPADERNSHAFAFHVMERIQADDATREPDLGETSGHFVELQHARHDDQRRIMEHIRQEGVCPFCPGNEHVNDFRPILASTEHWQVRENRWPYKNTRVHLLFIPRRHVELLSEFTPPEWAEFHELIAWAEKTYQLTGGSIGIRFGEPAETGATVRHLHAHLVVADMTKLNDPSYERVRFPMGPKPADKKHPQS